MLFQEKKKYSNSENAKQLLKNYSRTTMSFSNHNTTKTPIDKSYLSLQRKKFQIIWRLKGVYMNVYHFEKH